jgi:serine/threonine protein kinase
MRIEHVDGVIEALHDHDLLPPEQLAEVDRTLRKRCPTPQALVQSLTGLGWLNAFQAEQLLTPHGPELTVGPYRLLDRLGEGGVCRVFKARDARTDDVVALKVLRQQLMNNTEVFRRFQREIRVTLALDHPNIVHTIDAHLSESIGYLAMEYLPGTDLHHLVGRNGPLPVPTACDYIRQCALGLQHAHGKGLIHRDVKPANLMLTDRGVIKLLDLGLARVQRSTATPATHGSQAVTFEGCTLGTPDYMAPEQARNAKHADARADIYSLGCTFYYLLVGQPPFPNGTVMQKLLSHQQYEASPVHVERPAVPATLSALVKVMLAKKPEQRPATPADVAAALGPYCR